MPPSDDTHRQTLALLRVLILDALDAGKYLAPGAGWEPYHGGQRLAFRDRRLTGELSGALVMADCVTGAMFNDADAVEFGSLVIVGASLAGDVDLGEVRAHRQTLGSPHREVYWAVFVLQDSILVTIGGPPSSCRLISDILNAQMGKPFVQRRVCAYCHALNEYHTRSCIRCGKLIVSTGRLNQWMD
jgi:hypothetical protein